MQTKEGQPRGEGPRLEFQIANIPVHIADALDNYKHDLSTRNPGERQPGDYEAQALLYYLGNLRLTSDDYLRATPKLFEYAARPEGGFDRDFLALVFQEIDSTYMDPRHFGRFWGEHDTMLISLGRAYGRIELIKERIWDNPKMNDEKQKIVESARQHMRAYHSHLTYPDDPK